MAKPKTFTVYYTVTLSTVRKAETAEEAMDELEAELQASDVHEIIEESLASGDILNAEVDDVE